MKFFDTVLILFALSGGIFIGVVAIAGVWGLIESILAFRLVVTTAILAIFAIVTVAIRE